MTSRHQTITYGSHGSSLRDLPRLRSARRRRASSWDRSGGNDDWVRIEPGASVALADIQGAGSITHIWMTVGPDADVGPTGPEFAEVMRRLVLRVHWDGAQDESVLVPLGDFFGVGHARTVNFASLPLQMSPQDGRGLNSFFHMPFETAARITVTSEMAHEPVRLYYYVDYEAYDALDEDVGRFHASWHRMNPTLGAPEGEESNEDFLFAGTNLDGRQNYVILDATGRGHYVGCVLSIRNLRETSQFNWYGEGDDMIFIDGEAFPPSLHGTGTEDYFNTAFCPSESYSSAYHGITLAGGANWSGEVSMYRFHVEDPVVFQKSVRVTIEHGHANKRSDDVSSVAYWYQTLPQRPLTLAPVSERVLS
jgi:hypothetical protein